MGTGSVVSCYFSKWSESLPKPTGRGEFWWHRWHPPWWGMFVWNFAKKVANNCQLSFENLAKSGKVGSKPLPGLTCRITLVISVGSPDGSCWFGIMEMTKKGGIDKNVRIKSKVPHLKWSAAHIEELSAWNSKDLHLILVYLLKSKL